LDTYRPITALNKEKQSMASKTWLMALAAPAALSAALLGAPAHAATYASVSVNIAPPAPQVEVVPAPRRGQAWVPGHWQGRPRLNQYVWVPGRFVQVRAGYAYVAPRWVQVGGGWQFREGGWIPQAAYNRGVRDIDRDGIPDRWDADRDNDGTPNRADNRPNVPNAPPPPPRAETRPQARPGQVWVPGNWQWRPQSGYVWVAGHFESRRPGQIFVPAHWSQVNGSWQMTPGRWMRPSSEYRDSDGDGIADRYDRDRDGDGVPNRMDARPANPNR
jgi:hypothetical protein